MPIATKEFILNYAYNRWQFNYKRNIGPTSDTIRAVKPRSLAEWEEYFFTHMCSQERLNDFGHLLYQHIKNDLPSENRFHPELLASITESDCINYVYEVPIKRSYDGYIRER